MQPRTQTPTRASTLTIALALAASLAAVSVIAAEQSPAQPAQSAGTEPGKPAGGAMAAESKSAEQFPEGYRASRWIGKEVQNTQGETLGKVKELVMDDWGIVRFVVMESDRAEGKEGQLVAVPLGHFGFPTEEGAPLVFETQRTKLEGAPAFGAREWPDMGDPSWSAVVIRYWRPAGSPEGGEAMVGQQQGQQPGEQTGQTGDAGRQAGMTGHPSEGSASGWFDPNRDMVYLSKSREQAFTRLDDNRDGAITMEEAQDNPRLAERFDQIDTYGNRRITRSEFAAFEPKAEGQSEGQSESGAGMETETQSRPAQPGQSQ